jgi:hypothetical protein
MMAATALRSKAINEDSLEASVPIYRASPIPKEMSGFSTRRHPPFNSADLHWREAVGPVPSVNNLGTRLGNGEWETVDVAGNYEIIADQDSVKPKA